MSIQEALKTALAGRYDIERELGRGGMATVFLANDPRHDRKVAVKVLRPDLASTLGPERFLREITIAANLSHPHVVPLYDSGEANGFLYYVMPYVEGETLGHRLRREARIPLDQAVAILREVADALSCAHSRGVVHRDIKPDNIMITNRHAVVTDFGVAKAVSGATTQDGITNAGIAVGTPAYMAPEQVAADPHIDHRADIYAFGTLAYELLTGNPPFVGASPQVVLAAHITQAPDPVSTTCEGVPRDLESVVMRCLAKDPGDRWQSADELWAALGNVGAGATGGVRSKKKHAIVVLPFTNQSPDPENEFFSDGLTEEIIADLASVSALSVISRTSSMQLKGTEKNVRMIGRDLGVRYALEGSVRKAGQSLRITAQLIDALTDEQLWAKKYTGTMDDVFELQERVSREIVTALDVTLTSDEDKRLTERPVEDARAFELYLRVREAVRRHDVSERTFQLLDEAVEIEGRTPALEAMRGWAVVSRVRMGISRDRHELDEGEAIARDLLSKANNQIYGHALMGYVSWERGNQPQAVKHFERALEIEPNDADSLFYCGISLMAAGQNEQAAKTAERFLACDPLSSFAWMLAGNATWFVGRVREGIDKYETALEIDPLNFIIHWSNGYAHALIDDREALAKSVGWLEEHQANNPYTKQMISLMLGIDGKHQEAIELVDDIDVAPLDAHQTFHLAESFAMAGQIERGLDLLEDAVRGGFYPYEFVREHCPFLQPLRESPRFAEIETLAREKVAAFA